jgi:cytochrome c biogenesis protein
MITTLVSYLSHSQVWALQEGANVFVAGRSNRARIAFENEMNAVLDAVPELPPSALPAVTAAPVGAGKVAPISGPKP